MSEKLIISSELAERLALSTSTVLDWFEGRPAPGFKLGRALRFRESGASLDNRVDDVEALRRGDHAALRRQAMPTLSELVDEHLAQHVCEDNTKATTRRSRSSEA